MKRLLIEAGIQIVIWAGIAFVVGVVALIFAGTFGGVGAATDPKFNFGLVERFVCPQGSKLVYEEGGETTYTDSDGFEHTGTSISISCVAADGTRSQGKEIQAIFTLIGLYFLVCFVPLLLPAMLVSLIVVHMILSAFFKKNESSAAA